MRLSILLTVLLFSLACDASGEPPPRPVAAPTAVSSAPRYHPETSEYPFARKGVPYTRLEDAFEPPDGFARLSSPDGSFGAWLRDLPLLRDRRDVRAYDGRELSSPSAGIVPLDVGDRDLQQCADSAIRLHAEYLWVRNRSDELAYHFTSGDEVTYTDWVNGERITAIGSTVKRWNAGARDDDHASMREWLDLVFRYAGTRSLHHDSKPVKLADVRPGDFFVAPGSPGHAVVVLDVARHRDGRLAVLLGQGFMPAQEFHVIRSSADHVLDGVWFVLPGDSGGKVDTPSWKPFSASDLRRFVPG